MIDCSVFKLQVKLILTATSPAGQFLFTRQWHSTLPYCFQTTNYLMINNFTLCAN